MINTESKRLRVLQINLRSDYGGGPHHMYQLIKNLSSKVKTYAAMPKEIPYWDLNEAWIGAENCFELPHRTFSIVYLWKLIWFVRSNKIQVLHAQGKGASMYGRLVSLFTSVPCVYTFHGLHYGKYSLFKRSIYFAIENVLALFTKAFITVSESEKAEVFSYLPLLKNKMHLIFNGVEIPSKIARFPDKETVVICCIARLDYQKNLELLIPIVKGLKERLPNSIIQLNIIGVGNEDNELKRLIDFEGLSENIYLKGFSNNISGWLQKAHFYLSTSRWEGLPLSVLEASAHGLPVIVTDVTGNRDAVKNGKTGILFPREEPLKAVEGIVCLLENPVHYGQFSNAGQVLVKSQFSVLEMARKTEELYFSLTNHYKGFKPL